MELHAAHRPEDAQRRGHELRWDVLGRGFGVVAAFGALMLFLNVRMVRRHD